MVTIHRVIHQSAGSMSDRLITRVLWTRETGLKAAM